MTSVPSHSDPDNYVAPDSRQPRGEAPHPAVLTYGAAYTGAIDTTDRLRRVVSLSHYISNIITLQEAGATFRMTVPDASDPTKAYDVAIPIMDAARQSSATAENAQAALHRALELVIAWTKLEHERCLNELQRYTAAMIAAARTDTPA